MNSMNPASAQDPTIKYYSSRDSIGYWGAGVACVGIIGVGSSLAAHSLALTLTLLLGAVTVWWLGYWALSKNCYFISAANLGFKDAFRAREVEFDEIQSVTKSTGRDYSNLIFTCRTRTVSMPLDPIDDAWFSAVKAELHKRNIPISCTVFGLTQKEE